MNRKSMQAVFIDKDGTMGGSGQSEVPREFSFFNDTKEAVRRLKDKGLYAFALTNQAVVARGMTTLEQIKSQLMTCGIDDAYICPHDEKDDCACRKPKPGMLLTAAREKGLDLNRCAVIGDSTMDIVAAHRAGAVKILVRTGSGEDAARELEASRSDIVPDYIADDLLDAVNWLLAGNPSSPYTEEEIRNRLSVSTYIYKGHRSLSVKTLRELAENGFQRIELLESPDQYDMTRLDSMQHVFNDCREAGVEICAYHAFKTDLSEISTSEARQRSIDRCKRQIDTLREAGATIWGSHIRAVDTRTQECLVELLDYIEGTDVVIVLENFNRDHCRLPDRIETLKRIDHPHLGLVLDIGHVRNDQGENPMTLPGGPTETLRLCGNQLKFVHLHGFVETDHYPPFAEGDGIKWGELFRQLHTIGYGGLFNFESKGEAFHDNTLEQLSRVAENIVDSLHS